MERKNFMMTPRNKNYEEDIKHTRQLNDYVLLMLGIWPFPKKKSNLTRLVLKFSAIILCCSLQTFFVVPAVLYMLLIEKNPRANLKKLPQIFYNITLVAKYFGLLLRENKITLCFKHIEEDWKNVDNEVYRSIMREKARMGTQFLVACGALAYSSVFFHRIVFPLSRGVIVTPLNVTIRPLPCAAYYIFFDNQISPNYEIIFCLQNISGMVTFLVSTAICGQIALFVMHAVGQLEILVILMNRIVERADIEDSETNNRLAVMVEHQNRVRSFLQLVEATMQQICLLELTDCTPTMCFFGYCLITEWDGTNAVNISPYFVGLTCLLCHMFMFCFVGEQLTLQAEKVATTSSVLEWYRLPDKKARNVILIMAMSNCPLKVTAGNVVELSLRTFGQVVKTSVAYCNIMRTLTV